MPDEGENQTAHGCVIKRMVYSHSEWSEFAYGRSKTSPDSEQIEYTVAMQHVRNSVSVEQIQDSEESQCQRNFTNLAIHRAIALWMTVFRHLEAYEQRMKASAEVAKTSQSRRNIKEILRLKPQNDCKMRGEVSRESRKVAFTLAEVLITLGIIGVIAAITLAPLIQNYQEKLIVTQLKKQTNIMRQALIAAVSENGTPDTWFNADTSYQEATEIFVKNIKPHLKITKICNAPYPADGYDKYCTNEGKRFMGYINLILADGTIWYVRVSNPECYASWYYPYKMCSAGGDTANITVDVNGKRGKNKMGYDRFNFYLTTESSLEQYLWPAGNRIITNGNQQQFPRDCRWDNISTREGLGCTAWVLINENLDYLHCPEKLGWNKAKSCK